MFRVCHAFLSVHCSRVVNCVERAKLLDLLCVMFYRAFVTLQCCVLGQVRHLIVSISDLCLCTYFVVSYMRKYVHEVLLNSLFYINTSGLPRKKNVVR